MSYIDGYTFQRIKHLEPTIVEKTYHFLLDLAIRLAEHGLIHSDFNEYNILIDDKEPYQVYVIDFPQMVSTDHKEAKMFFDRDIACIERLFRKKHNFTCERIA
jgi:RIO kinase 2